MKKERKITCNFFRNMTYENYTRLENALVAYNPKFLELQPNEPNTLYSYYICIDKVYTWLRNQYNDDIPVLCNEMRAILGHLSEYNPKDDEQKANLSKAYSHFRRLSMDTLKILCNELDRFFDRWIQKYAKYDFRNTDNTFIPDYIKLYHKAHDAYIDVQQDENLGSDRNNSIIEKYHNVANEYLALYKYHTNKRRKRIENIAILINFGTHVGVGATIIFTIVSVIDAIISYI